MVLSQADKCPHVTFSSSFEDSDTSAKTNGAAHHCAAPFMSIVPQHLMQRLVHPLQIRFLQIPCRRF